jgi:hypothetical protein
VAQQLPHHRQQTAPRKGGVHFVVAAAAAAAATTWWTSTTTCTTATVAAVGGHARQLADDGQRVDEQVGRVALTKQLHNQAGRQAATLCASA